MPTDLKDPAFIKQLLSACNSEDNHFKDTIYCLQQSGDHLKFLGGLYVENAYFAGSSALAHLLKFWNLASPSVDEEFVPNDADLFILNRPEDGRLKGSIHGIDLVYTTAKTVEELLMNFDLPVCRVAMDFHCNVWVSAQALNAIITGNYYLPAYFRDQADFNKLLRRYEWSEHMLRKISTMPPECRDANLHVPPGEKMLFERLQGRIEKYRSRGFHPTFISTGFVMPWMKHSFCYVDWDRLVQTSVLFLLHTPAPAPAPTFQVSPVIIDAFSKIVQDPSIQKLLVDLGLLTVNDRPKEVTTPLTKPSRDHLDVIALPNPGFYRTVKEGFIIQQLSDGSIVAMAIDVNGVIRPLDEEEKRQASTLGIGVIGEPTPVPVGIRVPNVPSLPFSSVTQTSLNSVLTKSLNASTSAQSPSTTLSLKH